MERQHKFSIWYILLGIWGVLIIHNMIFSALSIKTIPYSEFLKLVKEGKVSEVAITQNQIQGRLVESGSGSGRGELFRTVRVDTDISKLLEENNIKFKGEIESTFFLATAFVLCRSDFWRSRSLLALSYRDKAPSKS